MKQVILVRKDLKIPKGKLAAQCSHASVESVLRSPKTNVVAWRNQGMKKTILKVDSEKELLSYQRKARNSKLVNALITDAGRTFFQKPTRTCLAIGPDKEGKIDKITGNLKLI